LKCLNVEALRLLRCWNASLVEPFWLCHAVRSLL